MSTPLERSRTRPGTGEVIASHCELGRQRDEVHAAGSSIPAPARRGQSRLLARTVMTSGRSVVWTSSTTGRAKHALEMQKSASPHCEQARGGPGRQRMPVGDGRGCVNPTKGGRGGGSRETMKRTHDLFISHTSCQGDKKQKITRGRMETFSSFLFHGQTPFPPTLPRKPLS